MFGLGKKERAREALRRGTAAALAGAFFHPAEIEKLGLNEEASSWIYTESLAHQLFALGITYSNSPLANEPWATAAFFNNAVSDAITQHERESGIGPGTINSFAFKRLDDFIGMGRPALADGQHFADSALKAVAKDPRADMKRISQQLKLSTEKYFQAAAKMFL
jgi:hypothetical protein